MTGIRVDHEGTIAWLTIDRPDRRNSLDGDAIAAMMRAIAELDRGTRLCVLRSADERVFIAGADIKEMSARDRASAAEFARAGQELSRAMERSPVVFGALVDGFALGGGTELVLSCDIVYATQSATFGLPEVRLGIFPGWGGSQRLVRAAGLVRGLPHLLSGQRFDARTAHDLGIVSFVVADAAAASAELRTFAESLAQAGPRAVAAAKRAARDGMDLGIDAGLLLELELWSDQFDSPERVEGMRAFIDRRLPNWSLVEP